MSCDNGRRPIGICQQPGQGGGNYPLVHPSEDVSLLLADCYLSYDDDSGQLSQPFHIAYLYGFGSDPAATPITPVHSYEVLVKDADGKEVFSTLDVPPSSFREVDWASRLRVLEWVLGDRVLRVVYHFCWDPDDTRVKTYPVYFEPESAELDGRAIYQLPPRITSFRVGLDTVSPDENGDDNNIRFKNGYNTEIDVEVLESVDGGLRDTEITFNAVVGSGRGRFGPGCDEEEQSPIRRINGIAGSARGNFIVDATGCYRVEQPIQATLSEAAGDYIPRTLQARHNALQLSNDCGPCCDCQDFINVWEAIRNQRNRYAELVARAQIARDTYHSNRDRWENSAACRGADRTRATLQPLPGGDVGVAVGYCNQDFSCAIGVVIHISFYYVDETGKCFDSVDPTQAFNVTSTAIYAGLVPNNTFRSGNTDPTNTATGGRPSNQEFYPLRGAYPHYWVHFDGIDPSQIGSVTFRQSWIPGEEADSDRVEMAVETFIVGPDPIEQDTGSLVPGYYPGAGPASTPDSMRTMTCPIKRAATIIPDLEESASLE